MMEQKLIQSSRIAASKVLLEKIEKMKREASGDSLTIRNSIPKHSETKGNYVLTPEINIKMEN